MTDIYTASRPLRVLHVLGRLDRGGIETWLMHILRHRDRSRLSMDFLVHSRVPGAYDDEAKTLGAKVISCPHRHRPWTYARALRHVISQYGPYDVVHSHVHFFSGWVMRCARMAGVPCRIAHSHIDLGGVLRTQSVLRRAYVRVMRSAIQRYATGGLACSAQAAADLFGRKWRREGRWQVLPLGIDLSAFRGPLPNRDLRRTLGLPENAFVIGHVGRFVDQKNHAFVVDVAAEVMRREPRCYLLLVGDGQLRGAVKAQVARLGIADRVVFAGARADVPQLMMQAMDLLVLPSRYEGLGLVVVEAQAAGLPCIVSESVPSEAEVVPDLVQRLPLDLVATGWAQTIIARMYAPPAVSAAAALETVAASPYDIHVGLRALERIYYRGVPALQCESLAADDSESGPERLLRLSRSATR